jgi:hypothetical protein
VLAHAPLPPVCASGLHPVPTSLKLSRICHCPLPSAAAAAAATVAGQSLRRGRGQFWSYYSWNNFTRLKPIDMVLAESHGDGGGDHQPLLPSVNNGDGDLGVAAKSVVVLPKRRLGVADLVFFGVGSTVGGCLCAHASGRACAGRSEGGGEPALCVCFGAMTRFSLPPCPRPAQPHPTAMCARVRQGDLYAVHLRVRVLVRACVHVRVWVGVGVCECQPPPPPPSQALASSP